MPWIRSSVLSSDKKAAPHSVKKKAINGFAPMKYNRKVTVVPGKSLRIATLLDAAAAIDVKTADTPAVPSFATLLTTEHTNIRRYVLEDILFLEVGMQVLFCVAPTHPNYESYEAMHDSLPTKVPRRSIGDVSYLQLNAIVVLHPRRSDLIGGVLARDEMFHLLTGNGNEGIGYHFGPNCEKHITWKEIFFHCDTIQVWGNSPPRRNYYQALHKVRDTATRDALFNRFASEIDGDKASTYDLCSAYCLATKYNNDKNAIPGANVNDTQDPDDDVDNNYSNNTDDDAAVAAIDDDGMHDDIVTLDSRGVDSPLRVPAVGVDNPSSTNAVSTVSTPPISLSLSHNDLAAVTPFAESLGLCGEALLDVIKFTEDIIKRRVKATYGCFISLTDPILIDSDLNAMVDFTFSKLPHQCFIIMSLLGYHQKVRRTRSEHLDKFCRRMTFYQIVSLSRIRFNQNFIHFGMLGAAMSYGISDKESSRRIPIFFGHACSYRTFFERTKEYRNLNWFYDQTRKSLAKERFSYLIEGGVSKSAMVTMAVFDNTQQNLRFTFQRGGNQTRQYRCPRMQSYV